MNGPESILNRLKQARLKIEDRPVRPRSHHHHHPQPDFTHCWGTRPLFVCANLHVPVISAKISSKCIPLINLIKRKRNIGDMFATQANVYAITYITASRFYLNCPAEVTKL